MALILFSGLPGSGKTSLANALALRLGYIVLRVDAIEAAMWTAGISKTEPTGLAAYVIAQTIADVGLRSGSGIIVDAVNDSEEPRNGWRDTVARNRSVMHIIEVVCPDRNEHRRRVEQREPDLKDFRIPTWQDVLNREYAPWQEPHLTVDTIEEFDRCLNQIEAYINRETPNE